LTQEADIDIQTYITLIYCQCDFSDTLKKRQAQSVKLKGGTASGQPLSAKLKASSWKGERLQGNLWAPSSKRRAERGTASGQPLSAKLKASSWKGDGFKATSKRQAQIVKLKGRQLQGNLWAPNSKHQAERGAASRPPRQAGLGATGVNFI